MKYHDQVYFDCLMRNLRLQKLELDKLKCEYLYIDQEEFNKLDADVQLNLKIQYELSLNTYNSTAHYIADLLVSGSVKLIKAGLENE